MSLLQEQFQKFLSDSEDNLNRLIEHTKAYHSGMIQDNMDWWDSLSEEDRNGLLEECLLDYDGDERDLIWWSGRLRLANELDQGTTTP